LGDAYMAGKLAHAASGTDGFIETGVAQESLIIIICM
jgi:hypothetical protein